MSSAGNDEGDEGIANQATGQLSSASEPETEAEAEQQGDEIGFIAQDSKAILLAESSLTESQFDSFSTSAVTNDLVEVEVDVVDPETETETQTIDSKNESKVEFEIPKENPLDQAEADVEPANRTVEAEAEEVEVEVVRANAEVETTKVTAEVEAEAKEEEEAKIKAEAEAEAARANAKETAKTSSQAEEEAEEAEAEAEAARAKAEAEAEAEAAQAKAKAKAESLEDKAKAEAETRTKNEMEAAKAVAPRAKAEEEAEVESEVEAQAKAEARTSVEAKPDSTNPEAVAEECSFEFTRVESISEDNSSSGEHLRGSSDEPLDPLSDALRDSIGTIHPGNLSTVSSSGTLGTLVDSHQDEESLFELNGSIIKVKLEDNMKFGAKLKSKQDDSGPQPLCVEVKTVSEHGAASAFGLTEGDKLILIDGMPVEGFEDYRDVLTQLRTKRPLTLTFITTGRHSLDTIPTERSAPQNKRQELVDKHELALLSENLQVVRDVSYMGILERYRPVFWRILLNYLPADRRKWTQVLQAKRQLYEQYKVDFLGLGLSSESTSSRPSRLEGQGWWETEVDDDKVKKDPIRISEMESRGTPPYSYEVEMQERADRLAAMSEEDRNKFLQHEKDVELRETIWKDVQRTHPGLHFFAGSRCEVMERILFIFAKLNPGVEYVQGMNEVVAPLLFVFGSISLDSDNDLANSRLSLDPYEFEAYYEADTFFCFCNLMGDMRDLYMQGMDSDQGGIKGKGERLMSMLHTADPLVWKQLTSLQINPHFFALRWVTTLLSRELMLPDTVRLWDSVFSDPTRFDFLLSACVAMIVLQRDNLLNTDFAGVIQILQKYPATDVVQILDAAHQIRTSGRLGGVARTPKGNSPSSDWPAGSTAGAAAASAAKNLVQSIAPGYARFASSFRKFTGIN